MTTTNLARPRRADAERNRARILAAASELFAERGLDASMPELAERAGVGIGTVYRAFPDKDHLLGAVMAERLRWLAGEIEAAAQADDPWAGFTDVIWKGAALHVKDRAFHQCMRAALELPEVREARGRTLDAFQRLIGRAQAAGSMRGDVVAEDIPMLLAGVGLSRAAGPGAAWERHLAVVIDGLRAEGAHPLPRRPLSRGRLDAIVSELPCPR
ncbi:MAG TPA: helix-turn-helix domain-containing protein [Solirubrobacteraceae bacterium]|jgi:AcrR family transcriptional regulator